MTDLKKQILDAVAEDLAAIEKQLLANLQPNLDLVREVAGHILFSGGKRLRPLLTVLCAQLCNSKTPEIVRFSTIFEFLHAATLVHDDVVDGGQLRRGQKTAHLIWDPPTAVLTGDFLLARSLSLAAETGRPAIVSILAHITAQMSQGEIHQLHNKGRLDLSEAEYLQVIYRKTAVLFEGACHSSAILADVSATKQQALADYGHMLGLAFQMADDLLDYTENTEMLGKEIGADLKEGKLTLPVIAALRQASDEDRRQMETVLQNPRFSISGFKHLVDLMTRNGGVAHTHQKASDCVARAKRRLAIFDPSPTRDLLAAIADYALARKQ